MLSRESYNHDVDAELNRAIDWLKAAKIDRVILSSDLHLSTQMVGADTSEFFPALDDVAAGLGMPEVTLPVVPGMEGCHWNFRKAKSADWPKLMTMLLSGKSVKAEDAVDWLIDASGSMNESLATAWAIAAGTSKIERRAFNDGVLSGLPEPTGLPVAEGPSLEAGRKAILDSEPGTRDGGPGTMRQETENRPNADYQRPPVSVMPESPSVPALSVHLATRS